MKEGWSYKKLGEVGTFIRGGNFSKKDFVENGFPCIHYGQIHMKFGIETFKHISSVPAEIVKPDRCAHKGDLVIAITSEDDAGSCKCTAWMGDCDAYVGGHTAIYRHTMQPKYVSYYFNSPYFQKEKLEYTHGFKVVEINPKDIAKINIPVPPLSEQRSIVARLDAAFSHIDALKTNADKQLNEARKLFQAELTECLKPKEGWEEKRIGDVFQTYAGGTPLKSGKGYYEGGTIPWIRSGEVCQMYIRNCEMYITEEGLKNSSAKYYPVDTILVAMYGATAAQVGILKFEATSNQAVCGILPHKDFVPEYIYYWFTNIQESLAAQAQGGAQPNLSQVKIKKVSISYPSRANQQAIVSHLDSLSSNIRKLEELQQKTIAECDALKQAMLKEVFE